MGWTGGQMVRRYASALAAQRALDLIGSAKVGDRLSAWTDALTAAREEEGPVLVSVVCAGQHARGVRRDAVVAVVRRTSYRAAARGPAPGSGCGGGGPGCDRGRSADHGRRGLPPPLCAPTR